MKIAIVQDGLMCKAGGEQVALSFHNAFFDAPIFTIAYDNANTFAEFKSAKIFTSWMQCISYNDTVVKRLFFPLGILAAYSIDVRAYDVILMSTTHCAKYIRVSEKALVICYSHNPFRLAWYPEEYKQYRNSKGIKRWFFDRVIEILRKIDKSSIDKVDFLLTNSTTVKQRLRNIYNNYQGEIEIIPPPVNINKFYISDKVKEYYLVVSRLEAYKRIDLVVDVFNELGLPLVIVGRGVLEEQLKKFANKNISFLKDLTTEELATIYSGAKAFIFPQLEDFGITSLEANASGIPVIAFGQGGVVDTQIPVNEFNSVQKSTAIFFQKQEKESLIVAIKKFMDLENSFDPFFIRKHAESFDEKHFIKKIKNYIKEKSHL